MADVSNSVADSKAINSSKHEREGIVSYEKKDTNILTERNSIKILFIDDNNVATLKIGSSSLRKRKQDQAVQEDKKKISKTRDINENNIISKDRLNAKSVVESDNPEKKNKNTSNMPADLIQPRVKSTNLRDGACAQCGESIKEIKM